MIQETKKKEKDKTESDILRDICEYLTLERFFFWRSNNIPVFGKNNAGKMTFRSMPKFSRKGVADILLLSNGRFIAIEVKRPGAQLRPDQKIFWGDVIANGGIYLIAYSLDDIKAELKSYNILPSR